MEDKNRLETAIQNLGKYLETRLDLFYLNASDKASDIISSIAAVCLIAVSMIFVLLFLSIGAAIWIGHSFGETSIGFLIIGLFYLLVAIILFAFRSTFIKMPVINKLLGALYSDEKD